MFNYFSIKKLHHMNQITESNVFYYAINFTDSVAIFLQTDFYIH